MSAAKPLLLLHRRSPVRGPIAVSISLAALCAALACEPVPGDIGDLTDGTTVNIGASSATTGTESDSSTSGVDSLDGTTAETGVDTEGPACGEIGYMAKCEEDVDRDGIPICEDNAPDHYNPNQRDGDDDGFGDIYDLCPMTPGVSNTADADRDGVGNACDRCRAADYNQAADEELVPAYMRVRNIPLQRDQDHDGIGDVCDNCVAIANCEDHDAMNPATENDLPEYPGAADPCQTPWEGHAMIGDACVSEGAPVQLPGAAGPVGFGPDDDWDQDGLRNTIDYCPRQPKPLELCVDEEDCPEDSTCSDGVCNHLDPDGDLVGTICDTCPFVANPEQRAEGGAELDDPDGDFIGSVCELDASCSERPNPRPVAHYPISVGGYCCVATWYEKAGPLEPNGVHDPNGVELLPDCAGYGEGDCRELPPSVVATPGVVEVPPGCEQALADSDLPISQRVFMDVSHPLVNGDVDVWRSYECLLPPLDQDFDGVADACDLCPFAFDPANQPYVDGGGELWPDLGKYCNGEYHPKFACEP